MSDADKKIAFERLTAKQAPYDTLWSYYDGDHPLQYSTARLREVFQRIDTKFIENYCAVIVNSVADRLLLKRFDVAGNAATSKTLNDLWQSTKLELDSDPTHLATLVTGESFVIAWPDKENTVQAYYNDPRLCHMQYDAENPHKRAWAAKWWMEADASFRMTLYYPNMLEYYQTKAGTTTTDGAASLPTSADAFQPITELPTAKNPYNEIPMFHFRRELRGVYSELELSLLTMQQAVNKLFSDMMVAAEFGAFPQRYIITNADTSTLKNEPNGIWEIPSGDGIGQAATVGQLTAAQLKNYIEALDDIANAMSAVSRTPKHYFFGQGDAPSGEALIAMESPLVKKCDRYIKRLSSTWEDVAAFMLRLQGTTVGPDDITSIWESPSTVQPKTTAEIRESTVRAGVPLVTALRREGWTDQEIADMQKEMEAEQAASSASLAEALVRQQRQFDQDAGVQQASEDVQQPGTDEADEDADG
jgi:hypothetical protein